MHVSNSTMQSFPTHAKIENVPSVENSAEVFTFEIVVNFINIEKPPETAVQFPRAFPITFKRLTAYSIKLRDSQFPL